MNNYLILLTAMILGQSVFTAITVYILQKKKDIAYAPALKAYVAGEMGLYIIALLSLLVIMFLMPDYINPSKEGLPAHLWMQKYQVAENFRLYALGWGVFSPLISLVIFKKGKNAIEKKDSELSVG